MNAALIKPFLVSTQRVFEKMLECPCRIGKPSVSRALAQPDNSVCAVIQVSGSHAGYMVLGMPTTVADVAAALLDIPESADSASRYIEAVGTVVRMVKTILRRGTGTDEMSFQVVPDSQFAGLSLQSQDVWLTAPMIGRFGTFSFALSLKPVSNAKPTGSSAAPNTLIGSGA